ncbi:MAG: hypothetical protein KGD63_09445 [Candidatus Lokiarchaeota archaeon]|nr:hypothetical protein [Candidatus Lokiarchaeota archaeon]
MYQNPKNMPSYYEQQLRELQDLFLQYRNYMQNLESKITNLKNENSQLRSQLQQLQHSKTTPRLNPPQVRAPPQQTYSPQPTYKQQTYSPQQPIQANVNDNGARKNKRKCPRCGAMGFAIKEFEDKNRIISYIPRRIYAIKKVCTKCFNEF